MLENSVSHWKVEIMHNIRDNKKTFNEDKCKIYHGNAPEILTTFRKLSINVMACLDEFIEEESVRSIMYLINRHLPYMEAVQTKKTKEVGPFKGWAKKMKMRGKANTMPI
jgi:hypothetical protein